MPLNRHINGFAVLQAADIAGAYNGTFTGHIPRASSPTKHPVASYVLLFGISTRPVIRSCIGTVDSLPVTDALASAPSISMAFAKLPDGMYGSDGPCFPSLRVNTLRCIRLGTGTDWYVTCGGGVTPFRDKTPSAVEQQRCPAAGRIRGCFRLWFAFRAGR